MYLRVFNRPTLVLNSVEAARDLLDKRSAKYSDRPHFTLLVDMSVCKASDAPPIALIYFRRFGFDPNPALMSYGPWWRQHRVWLHSGLMEKNSLIKFHPLVRRETSKFVSALIDSPDNFILHTKRCEFQRGCSVPYHAAYWIRGQIRRRLDDRNCLRGHGDVCGRRADHASRRCRS